MDPPHSYHTRTHSKDTFPPFPPPNIVLHPDDATNKVFLAVARAFISVDNRAMTIKDIAERASHYGLVCQNLSAAAQAVTTYLRAHKARCEKEQDVPLLLNHTLSGTTADDDLVPALYSRSGGDSHPLPNRLTNFRKGTAVWYLSRATGVSCPFAKAGIRLCDYVYQEPEHLTSSRERQRRDTDSSQSCGQKRKRPLRGCIARPSVSDNERPPKVKLTLRLKPLSMLNNTASSSVPEGTTLSRPIHISKEEEDSSESSEDSEEEEEQEDSDEMSVDEPDNESRPTIQPAPKQYNEQEQCLPPYPRRSISIPCYTPSIEAFPNTPYSSTYKDPLRHSPSIFNNFATPPPDSDDEAEDFHVAMAQANNYSDEEDEMGWDGDLDSEEEGDTTWESPGPRSPSAPPMSSEITVKEEPRDLQGLLDAWESIDSTASEARFGEHLVLDALPNDNVKLEPIDHLDWNLSHGQGSEWRLEDTTAGIIKQEELDVGCLFPPGPSSPLTELSAQFSAFSYSDSSSPYEEFNDNFTSTSYATLRPRAKTVPAPLFSLQTPMPTSAFSLPPSITRQAISGSELTSKEFSVPSTALAKLIQSMSVNTSDTPINLSPPAPCVSPLQTRCQPVSSPSAPVVVTTCQPCKPAISATQIEDISVYQMMLGAFQLLRRIDTDFVNLSPIVAFSGAAHPINNVPYATVVTKGSPEVSGTWVPLSAAQAYVGENLSGEGAQALEVFLSDNLVDRFPPALQDFHRNTAVRGLNQFGRHFASTLQASKWDVQTEGGASLAPSNAQFQAQPASAEAQHFVTGLGIGDKREAKDEPLSATEQELFHELCVIPDEVQSDDGAIAVDLEIAPANPSAEDMSLLEPLSPLSPIPPSPPPVAATPISPLSLVPSSIVDDVPPLPDVSAINKPPERPLRRSKRVASALAASQPTSTRSRTRKGGSRNTLS